MVPPTVSSAGADVLKAVDGMPPGQYQFCGHLVVLVTTPFGIIAEA